VNLQHCNKGTEEMQSIDLNGKNILITGAAGFIGANLGKVLLQSTHHATIVGVDNLNDYYDVGLKQYRLNGLQSTENPGGSQFIFHRGDISAAATVKELFKRYNPDIVVNLAAQAGVRYSVINPDAYIHSNIVGFYNILEACRTLGSNLMHLVYASSSSVYGGNTKIPFSETDFVDAPQSLYAATKKSNELLAHSYAELYNIPCTGLRFFTVYGPAGRPDMAYYSFTQKLISGEKIRIFNYGNCMRDFTYVDDIVEGIVRVMQGAPKAIPGGHPPHSIYNIGHGKPEQLLDFVQILSEELIRAEILPCSFDFEAHRELVPMQLGDVPITYADTSKLEQDFGFKPATDLRTGLRKFAEWFKGYYKI